MNQTKPPFKEWKRSPPKKTKQSKRLRQCREACGIKYATELSVKAGLSKCAVGMYETGKRSPSSATMVKIFTVLKDYGVPMEFLMPANGHEQL